MAKPRSAGGQLTIRHDAKLETPSRAIGPLADRAILADRIFEAIHRAILSLELEPGTALVERELAQRFGVSKSPVRDALQRLAGEGLVSQSPHRGMTVIEVDRELADEIYELREVLEEMAVRLATPILTPADVSAARAVLDRAQESIDGHDLARAAALNREFHGIFCRRSANRPLEDALSRLQDRVRIISVLSWRQRPSMREEHEQHAQILQAAAAGDAKRASSLMREHIHAFRLHLDRFFGEESVRAGVIEQAALADAETSETR
ncbi:GntR family transcriptional regulator [bacterium]|nr:MAG: GntR family transcriptional regulator [bacterium]